MEQKFYDEIKNILITARNKVYQTANFAMVEAYWNIGKSIIEEQGGNEKAEYGTGLLKELSKQMTQDFGKGFTVANLKNMRQFYLTFPNGYALRSELSWTHYRLLMRVENDKAREFYMQEAVKSQWSTRQLERQINSFFYERLLSSKNKDQVAKIAELLRSINLSPRRDIFCSSLPGYGIPNGANIFDFLRERFRNYDLHIIFVHSPEYYESAVSLNEMGAAWVLKSNATSLLLPGFDFSGMKGVIGSDSIAIKLDGDQSEVKDRLNQLRRELEAEFNIPDNEDIIWEDARDKFIREINDPTLEKKDNITPASVTITEEMKQLLRKVAVVPEGQILTGFSLELGTYIQIGGEVVAKEYLDRRQYAIWDEALNTCLHANYIERKSDAIYVITNAGYKVVE